MEAQKILFVIFKDGKIAGEKEAFNSGVALIRWILEEEGGNITDVLDPEYMNRFTTLIDDKLLFDFKSFQLRHNPMDTIKN